MTKVEDTHAVFLSNFTPRYIPRWNKCIDVWTRIFKVSSFIREKILKQIKSTLAVEWINNFVMQLNVILYER